jgi:hypothetical protein
VEAKPRRGNKPKEGTGLAPAATSVWDTDSSVEQDPGAGRSVDRAPRHGGRGHDAIDAGPWWTSGGGGEPPTEGNRAEAAMPEQSPRSNAVSSDRGDEAGSRIRSVRADRETRPEPAKRSPRGEARPAEPQPGDRRFDTVQAHAAHEGGATRSRTDGRRTGARGPSPRGGWRTAPGVWRARRKRRIRQRRIEPLDPHSSSDEVGAKPRRSRDRPGDERQEGSRPQRCGTATDEEQTFAGWSASGDIGPGPRSFGFDDRPEGNLANPDPVPAATCRES